MKYFRSNPLFNLYHTVKLTIPLFLIFVISCQNLFAQDVDERIELISTICKLADYEEYNMDSGRDYVPKWDRYFIPYKGHKVVDMFKRLQSTHNIGYDAPVIFALSLEKSGDSFIYDKKVTNVDERLKDLNLAAIADTISMFYRDSSFRNFYEDMLPFYQQHSKEFAENVMSKISKKWYADFYGRESDEIFNIVIGYLLGGCNYGPTIEKEGYPRNVYAVMGYVMRPDSITAYQAQPEVYRDILIHEFNHSFVNPLLNPGSQLKDKMEIPGRKLLNQCNFVMEMQSYPEWENVINESIVRAAVACYLLDNGTNEEVRNSIIEDMRTGFAWMPQLVNKLNYYRKNRSLYPNFESFYPEIISFFEDYTQQTDTQIENLFSE